MKHQLSITLLILMGMTMSCGPKPETCDCSESSQNYSTADDKVLEHAYKFKSCDEIEEQRNKPIAWWGSRDIWGLSSPSICSCKTVPLADTENQTATTSHTGSNSIKENIGEDDIIAHNDKLIFSILNNTIRVVNKDLESIQEILKVDGDPLSLYLYKNQLVIFSANYGSNQSKMTFFDVSNSEDIIKSRSLVFDGVFKQSRIKENELLVFFTSTIDESISMPKIYDSNSDVSLDLIKCEDIYYGDTTGFSEISFSFKFDLEKMETVSQAIGFKGNFPTLHVNEDHIYLTNSSYWENNSAIHLFNINDLKYVDTGKVPGIINNDFSLDEYNNFLRVLSNYSGKSEINIFSVGEKLKSVGSLKNLTLNEDIFGVRFMKDWLYFISFYIIDPLHVINLQDPTHPVEVGKLEVPGFSSYLHPIDENHLLAVGQITENFNNFVELSIFDVTNPAEPKRMHYYKLNKPVNSRRSFDYKEFNFSNNTLVVPVEFTNYVFDVSLEKGFSKLGRILHIDEQYDYCDNNPRNILSLIQDDKIYSISSSDLAVAKVADPLEEIFRKEFEDVTYDYNFCYGHNNGWEIVVD